MLASVIIHMAVDTIKSPIFHHVTDFHPILSSIFAFSRYTIDVVHKIGIHENGELSP
jgi:hypothetical protein